MRTRLPLLSVHNENFTAQFENNKGLEKQVHKQRCRKMAFVGVNVICFGGVWLLDPTGDVAFASNPEKCDGDPNVDRTINMFSAKSLESDTSNMYLQPWRGESRVWELSQNIRSGEDEWFSEVLEQCRQGELSQANYNFLHGVQEHAPVNFCFHRRKDGRRWHKNQACSKLQSGDDCKKGSRTSKPILRLERRSEESSRNKC